MIADLRLAFSLPSVHFALCLGNFDTECTASGFDGVDTPFRATRPLDDRLLRHHSLPRARGEPVSLSPKSREMIPQVERRNRSTHGVETKWVHDRLRLGLEEHAEFAVPSGAGRFALWTTHPTRSLCSVCATYEIEPSVGVFSERRARQRHRRCAS